MTVTNRQIALIILAVIATIALPILAAITVARNQAMEHEEAYVRNLALSALRRNEQASDQLMAGQRALHDLTSQTACSHKGMERMREIDLSSTLLQAVAHIDGTVVDCSSLAGPVKFDIGPPNVVSAARGTKFWTHIKPLRGKHDYVGVGIGSFLGIIHKDLLIGNLDEAKGLSLGTFSWSARKILIDRGDITAKEMALLAKGEGIYRTDNRTIAVVKSKRYDLAVLAALPRSRAAEFARQQGLILIPLGLITGVLLSLMLVRVLKSRMSMPMLIRSALRSGEFHLLYQPAVDLATGRTIGAEALIRWRRPDGELIPPDSFIAVAEQAGVIRAITTRVLALLAEDARETLRIMPQFRFSVNFSAEDMHSAEIVDEVHAFIDQAGIGCENLVIEATERSFLDVDRAQHAIAQFREAGIKVAIDDFGTGFSSLSCLAQLKIDLLKIDRLFVHALGTDSATNQVASRIIDMAKDLNLKIVAEGIETPDQAARLLALGVDYGQGFHLGHPMTIDALMQRLRAERSAPANVTKLPARAA